ncbi:MAG: hypothetical protein ACREP9_03800, partial [Candidatus Dormibacteraceae bacterium]
MKIQLLISVPLGLSALFPARQPRKGGVLWPTATLSKSRGNAIDGTTNFSPVRSGIRLISWTLLDVEGGSHE